MMELNFAVLGPHNRGRISLLGHRPEEGLRLVAVCGHQLSGLEEYRAACGPSLVETTDYRRGYPTIEAPAFPQK